MLICNNLFLNQSHTAEHFSKVDSTWHPQTMILNTNIYTHIACESIPNEDLLVICFMSRKVTTCWCTSLVPLKTGLLVFHVLYLSLCFPCKKASKSKLVLILLFHFSTMFCSVPLTILQNQSWTVLCEVNGKNKWKLPHYAYQLWTSTTSMYCVLKSLVAQWLSDWVTLTSQQKGPDLQFSSTLQAGLLMSGCYSKGANGGA